MSRQTSVVGLLAVVAIALLVRMQGVLERSMWFDEAVTWEQVANFSWSEMVRRIGLAVHPPGFFGALRVWTLAAGSSLISLRLFSIAWAALGVVATYLFCRDAFAEMSDDGTPDANRGRGIGVTAAGFFALGSYHIVWSQQARMYAMGATLALFSSWMLIRALRSNSSRWWAAYTLSAVAAMYTHNFLLFTVFAQGCVALAVLVARSRREQGVVLSKAALMTLCAVYGAASLAYLPWLSTVLAQSARVHADYWIPPFSLERLLKVWYELFIPKARRYGMWGPGIVAGVTVVVLALCAARRRMGNGVTVSMAIIPVFCAIAISVMSSPIIVSRYALYSQVFVFIALAEVLWRLSRAIRMVLVVAVVCDLVVIHVGHWNQLAIRERPGLAAAMRHVLDQRRPDEPVVSLHPSIFHAVDYYARPEVCPKLLLEIPMSEVPHYKGGPLLVDEDVIGWDELNAMPVESIWLVSTTGFSLGFERVTARPPWRYQRGSGQIFPEVFDFQGEIIVGRYIRAAGEEIAGGADGSDGS